MIPPGGGYLAWMTGPDLSGNPSSLLAGPWCTRPSLDPGTPSPERTQHHPTFRLIPASRDRCRHQDQAPYRGWPMRASLDPDTWVTHTRQEPKPHSQPDFSGLTGPAPSWMTIPGSG